MNKENSKLQQKLPVKYAGHGAPTKLHSSL